MIKLLNGNNLDLIKNEEDKSINCVVTSPPYFNSGKKYQRGKGCHYTNDFSEPLYNIIDIMELIKPKLKDKGVVCLNLGFSYAETGIMRPFDIVNRLREKCGYFIVDIIIWNKKNPIPLRNRLTNAFEYIFVLSNSPHIEYKNKNHKTNIINESVASYKGHNAVFPESIVENLLETFTEEGDMVLDCYMGSGTTAAVCQKMNRNCIGYEINENYVELSKERLKN
jgi:DNA modification methylase